MRNTRWNRWKSAMRLAAGAAALYAGSAHAQYGGPILSPPSLNFPPTQVGQTSPVQFVTVNSPVGETTFQINSIVLPAGFNRSGGTCPTPVAAAANGCTVGVVFAPTIGGAQGGNITINSDAFGFPGATSIPVGGNGVVAVNLGVSVSDNPDPVEVGQPIAYSIVVTKDPVATAPSDIELTISSSGDALYPPVANGSNWVCSSNSFPLTNCTYTAGAAGATLPTLTLTYNPTFDSSSGSITANENFSMTAPFIDPSGPANVTETTTYTRIADVTFLAGASITPGTVNVGELATIDATPRNNGPSFDDLTVTITLPPQVTAVVPVPSNFAYLCSFVAPVVTCVSNTGNRGGPSSLPPIQVRALTASATPVNIPLVVSSPVTDPVPGNNTLILPLGITGPDLTPQFDDLSDPVATGQTIIYQGNLSNVGNGTSLMVNPLVVTPTPAASFVGFTGAGWSCTGTSTVNCNYVNAIAPSGFSNVLTLNFTAPGTPGNVNTSFVTSGDGNPANDTDTEVTTVANNDLALTGSGAPLSGVVPYNSTLTLTPSYTGAGPNSATSYSIIANLPTGVALVSVDPMSTAWTCSAPGVNPINCFIAPITRGNDPGPISLPTLGLTLSKSSVGQSTVPFVLSANTGITDPVPANNTLNYVIDGVAPTADLSISKTGPATAIAGQNYSYSLAVTNSLSSGIAAANIQLSDTLPTGVSFQSFTQGTGAGGTWTCNNAGQVFSCTLPSLPVGGAAPVITLNVRYTAATLPPGGSVSNTATVTALTTDPASTNNSGTAVTTITGSSDLTLSVVDSADPVSANQNFSYTISPRNIGPIGSNTALLELGFNLAQVDFIGTTAGTGWSCPGSASSGTPNLSCTYSGAVVAAGGNFPTVVLNLRARALSASASHVLNAKISSTVFDPVTSNNDVSETTGINPFTTLSLSKIDDVDPVTVNSIVSYTLSVGNQGPSVASSLVVVDTLPNGLQFVGASGNGWSCSDSNQTVTCNNPGPLAANASSALIIQARALAAGIGSVTNQARASAAQTINDASASQSTTIRARAELSLSKTASRSQAGVGDTIDFTLDVRNEGLAAVTGLVLQDPLPSNFEFISVAGEGWTCTQASNLVDCRRQRLDVGQSSSVVINTRARTVGNATNSASVRAIEGPTPVNASAVVEIVSGGVVNLAASKSASQQEVATGGGLTYNISVRNTGTVLAQGVVIEDVLPTGFALNLADPPLGTTCSESGGTVRCTLQEPLQPNIAVNVRLLVRVDRVVNSGCQSVRNTVTVSTTSTEANLADNSASADVSVCAVAGLQRYDLQVTASPASIPFGNQMVNLTIRNIGIGGYPGGPLNIDFGTTGLRLESLSGGCSSADQVASCVLPPIAANGVLNSLVLGVRPQNATTTSGSGQIRVFAVPVAPGDVNEDNNVALVTVAPGTTPPDVADLRLTGRAVTAQVLTGADANFEFVATNLGPAVATGVAVVLNVPAGVTLGNATAIGGSCLTTGAQVRCTPTANLAKDASLTVNLGLRVPDLAGNVVVSGNVTANTVDPVASNNQANATATVRMRTPDEIGTVFSQCAGLDRMAQISVEALSQACSDPASSLQPVCRALISAATAQSCDEVRNALSEIAPKEVLAQSLLLKDFANTQFFNVDARLSELRGGGGGFSLSGLNYNNGRQSISIGTLRDLLRAVDGEEEEEAAFDEDLVSPWGFFINGSISNGEQDLNTQQYKVQTDFESRGITAGVDYRFSSRLVGGIALGYARFDADVSERSSLDTTARSLTAYGSWYPRDRVFFDARLSLGKASFDLDRRIQFTTGGQSFSASALGSTDADQLTFASSVGYHYNNGPWSITPNLAVRYVKSDVDAFTETGAPGFNVSYGDQSISSSQVALGVQITRPFSLSSGVLSPQFDFSLNREIDSDDLVLEARLVGASASQVFELRDDEIDQTYGTVGLGFVYITSNGRQAYLSYRRLVGQDGVDRGTINLGGRFEF